MLPQINHEALIHHVNRAAGITERTFCPNPPKDCDSLAAFTGNTEVWAKYATVKKSPST
jgi:hypothetical protein